MVWPRARYLLLAVAVPLAIGVAGVAGYAIDQAEERATSPACAPAPLQAPPNFLERQEIAAAKVEAALEAVRPRLKARCWIGMPPEARMVVIWRLTFDRSGCEARREIVGGRGADPAVVECLRSIADMPLAIPAPGEIVDVQTVLSLP
jgi:hypothetical protein